MILVKKIKRFVVRDKLDILVLSTVIFIGVIVFRKSFSYGLFGDDWHHYYFLMFCKAKSIPCMDFILNPYGGETSFMNIMEELFGFSSTPYYIASFIFRSFAAVTLYKLIRYVTKKRLYAFVGSLLFIVSLGGIVTTDWVHYANVYFALALLNIGVLFLLKYQEGKDKLFSKNLFFYYIFFTLSIVISPVRLHGLLFLYPISEVLLVIFKKTSLKRVLVRIAIFVLIVFFLKKVGFFGKQPAQVLFIDDAIKYMFESLENFLEVFLRPLGSFSNMLFPKQIFEGLLEFLLKNYIFLLLPIIIFNYLLSLASKFQSKMYILPILGWVTFLVFFRIVFKDGSKTGGQEVLLGGMTVFLLISLCVFLIVNRKFKFVYYLLFFLFWPFNFILVPHVIQVYKVIPAEKRYMNIPTQGAIILFIYSMYVLQTVVLKSLGSKFPAKRKKILSGGKLIFVVISLYLIYVNATSVFGYFKRAEYRRKEEVVDSVFGKTVAIIDKYKDKGNLMVIFDYDDSLYWHNTVYFGGTYRYFVEKDVVYEDKTLVFIGMEDLEYEFKKEGFIKSKYGRPLPEEGDIVGIRVQMSGEVYEITEEIIELINMNLKMRVKTNSEHS